MFSPPFLLPALSLLLTALVSSVSAVDDTCLQGYVWREACPGDHVCVLPWQRDSARAESDPAVQSPRHNADGSCKCWRLNTDKTCKTYYVKRDAAPGDTACVTPSGHLKTHLENVWGKDRTASLNIWLSKWWQWHDAGSYTPFWQLNGDHFNLGTDNLLIKRWGTDKSGNTTNPQDFLVREWKTESGKTADGKVAGTFTFVSKAQAPMGDGSCASYPNNCRMGYFRVYDKVSQRWSDRLFFQEWIPTN